MDNTLNNFIVVCRSCKNARCHLTHFLEGIKLICLNCGYEAELILSPVGNVTTNLSDPLEKVFPGVKIEKGTN